MKKVMRHLARFLSAVSLGLKEVLTRQTFQDLQAKKPKQNPFEKVYFLNELSRLRVYTHMRFNSPKIVNHIKALNDYVESPAKKTQLKIAQELVNEESFLGYVCSHDLVRVTEMTVAGHSKWKKVF
jgi:hypothetical protein